MNILIKAKDWLYDFEREEHSSGWRGFLGAFIFNPIRCMVFLPILLILAPVMITLHYITWILKKAVFAILYENNYGDDCKLMQKLSSDMVKEEVIRTIGKTNFIFKGSAIDEKKGKIEIFLYRDYKDEIKDNIGYTTSHLLCFINGKLNSWGWKTVKEIEKEYKIKLNKKIK